MNVQIQKVHVLKGHGFSRAARKPLKSWALAPEGRFRKVKYIPRRLKPCPFKVIAYCCQELHAIAQVTDATGAGREERSI
jgi:hypothetical protein